jgi:hypothetical protein
MTQKRSAMVSKREDVQREIEQRLCAIYRLPPEEIEIVEERANR